MANSKILWFKGYKIIITEIERDWSEDAYKYEVPDFCVEEECEGYDNALRCAQDEIYEKGEK